MNSETASNATRPSLRTDAESWALVADNLGLIWFTINRYFGGATRPEHELDRMYSDGVTGLFRAAQLWEPAKAKFSTYGVLWARQAISRGLNQRHDSFTRAAHRRGEQSPVALDDIVVDAAVATDDPASAAVTSTVLAAAYGACRDDVDRALLKHLLGHSNHRLVDIGAAFQLSQQGLQQRRKRLLERIAPVVSARD